MGKVLSMMVDLKLDKIYAKDDSVWVDITECTGILSMVETAMPYINMAVRSKTEPFEIYVERETLFAMNKIVSNKYVDNAVRIYFSCDKYSKPFAIFMDVKYATTPSKKREIVSKLNAQIAKDNGN